MPEATTGLAASAKGKYDAVTPPKPSSLPADVVNQLTVDLSREMEEQGKDVDVEGLLAYQRVAHYLSAAQIFLRENALLTAPLEMEHVKRRLLGHSGTSGGLIFAYSHANYLITKHDKDQGGPPRVIFVTGPGHGAPAILSCLFMEGSITRFYPEYPMSVEGLSSLIKRFSMPGGFASHVNAETPGSIHEGGELGYALAVSWGAVMDKPDLITVCVVGDGEAETGPTATAWHSHKYIDPAESGACLPIVSINGYKIGERTIYGTMDDLELTALFVGYGYQPRIVEYGASQSDPERDVRVNKDMAVSMEWAYSEIRKIQQAARSGKPVDKPRWPVILMRTPKGWTGPKKLGDNVVEGSWRSHQVPLPAAAKDPEQFDLLKKWLESYHIKELVHTDVTSGDSQAHDASNTAEGLISSVALRIVPRNIEARMGMVPETFKGYRPLDLADWKQFGKEADKDTSAMEAIGSYLADTIKRNPKDFRIYSPDEVSSNKLSETLEVSHRNFQWDPETAHDGGRVIEMLSEHTLQGWMQGYTLTGRTAVFPSYESFLGIVTTMIEQYAKFMKMASETKWRGDVASLNYIETSTLWRQEHNGYSHQNPALIGSLMALPKHSVRIFFPADANAAVSVMAHCLRSKNYVNLIVGAKAPTKVWLDVEETERHCLAGASVWKKYSTDDGLKPDVVLVGIGVEVTHEVIAASALLRNEGVRVRVVNVVDMMILGQHGHHPHALTEGAFNSLFTADKPVFINFHGYPKEVAALLFGRKSNVNSSRFTIHGYEEEGTTTTPYSMLRLNHATRFDLAHEAVLQVAIEQPDHPIATRAHVLGAVWKHKLREHEKYTIEHGEDPEWTEQIEEVK